MESGNVQLYIANTDNTDQKKEFGICSSRYPRYFSVGVIFGGTVRKAEGFGNIIGNCVYNLQG